jgi:hypothetical protein
MFTGSESILASFIFAELKTTFPEIEQNPETVKRMQNLSRALANAIVKWILTSSVNSVEAQIIVQPGQAVVAPPPSGTGTTTTPGTGSVVVSKLK